MATHKQAQSIACGRALELMVHTDAARSACATRPRLRTATVVGERRHEGAEEEAGLKRSSVHGTRWRRRTSKWSLRGKGRVSTRRRRLAVAGEPRTRPTRPAHTQGRGECEANSQGGGVCEFANRCSLDLPATVRVRVSGRSGRRDGGWQVGCWRAYTNGRPTFVCHSWGDLRIKLLRVSRLRARASRVSNGRGQREVRGKATPLCLHLGVLAVVRVREVVGHGLRATGIARSAVGGRLVDGVGKWRARGARCSRAASPERLRTRGLGSATGWHIGHAGRAGTQRTGIAKEEGEVGEHLPFERPGQAPLRG